MIQIHLFGAATPSGEAFRALVAREQPTATLMPYSRRQQGSLRADFEDPELFEPAGIRGETALWISFGPIWLLAPFVTQLARQHPERVQDLRGLIACSSSSALTKRYAANRFDKELVARLRTAEDQLINVCQGLAVPCRILRPTLIYGQAGPYGDRNLSRLLAMMRRLPVLPLPAQSGLRQPIHASQLAAVTWQIAQQIAGPGVDPALPQRVAVGGDTRLSYRAMVEALREALPPEDPARRCQLVAIPNRLFGLLAAPLLLRSPQGFEAILRMGADLADFQPSHKLAGQQPQPFPVLPLAI